MARRPGGIKKVTSFTDTTLVRHDGPIAEGFMPDWDKEPGAAQQMIRVKKRVRMRAKKTPIGRGVAVRTR